MNNDPWIREMLETMIRLAVWQIGHGDRYHPKLPAAIAEARAALRRHAAKPLPVEN